jgi:hypothetical protein
VRWCGFCRKSAACIFDGLAIVFAVGCPRNHTTLIQASQASITRLAIARLGVAEIEELTANDVSAVRLKKTWFHS